MNVRGERAAIAHTAVGTGYEAFLNFEEPYDAVELDAYSINAFFVAEFETPEGTVTEIQLQRIWLIALIEVISQAILSYLDNLTKNHHRLHPKFPLISSLKCPQNFLKFIVSTVFRVSRNCKPCYRYQVSYKSKSFECFQELHLFHCYLFYLAFKCNHICQ